jgi:iron(III) transport system ATP-binding protein
MPDVVVEGLTKRFGANTVLDDVAFTAHAGELFTLLGPSGCGKTTTLLSVAGFLSPDAGTIRCGDEVLLDRATRTNVPAERRDLGMVFQSYAVWPHMTVADNVAFPLRVRKLGREQRRQKVADALELVELGEMSKRYPHELSGGQRQRVALARALVYSPRILLLDEPFSNLDAKLRERARTWVRQIQQRLGVTTLFVTHDQDEALAISDRILVMDGGHVQQVGTPEEIYRRPQNEFVATFVGQTNVLRGTVVERIDPGRYRLALAGMAGQLDVDGPSPAIGSEVSVSVRPEAMSVVAESTLHQVAAAPNVFDCGVESVAFLGDHYRYELASGALRLIMQSPALADGSRLAVSIPPHACAVLPGALAPVAHPNGAVAEGDLAASLHADSGH